MTQGRRILKNQALSLPNSAVQCQQDWPQSQLDATGTESLGMRRDATWFEFIANSWMNEPAIKALN